MDGDQVRREHAATTPTVLGLMLRAAERFGQDPLEWIDRVHEHGPFWRRRIIDFELERSSEDALRREAQLRVLAKVMGATT